jgi:hypothetical protein
MYRDFTELIMRVVMWCVSPVPSEVLSRPRSTQRVRRVLARSEPTMRPEETTGEVCRGLRVARGLRHRGGAPRDPRAPGPAGLPPAARSRAPRGTPTSAYVCRQKTGSDGARNTRTGARRTMTILDLTGRAASSMYRELSVGSPCELRPRRVTGGRRAPRPCRGRLPLARRRALPQRHLQTLKPLAPARWSTSCVLA